MRASIETRFWDKVKKELAKGCWNWTGCKIGNGYGKFCAFGTAYAHRVSWILHYGDIPEGLCVLHKCDNPACIRPDHLFLGTHDDNMKDMKKKGRQNGGKGLSHGWYTKPESRCYGDKNGMRKHPESVPRGESNGCAIITEEIVREIRRLCKRGNNRMRYADVATMFGVSRALVASVNTRRSWKHVE